LPDLATEPKEREAVLMGSLIINKLGRFGDLSFFR